MKKFVQIDGTIVNKSLIETVTQEVFGSGAKSNPYQYVIKITFTNGHTHNCTWDDETKANQAYDQLFKDLNNIQD